MAILEKRIAIFFIITSNFSAMKILFKFFLILFLLLFISGLHFLDIENGLLKDSFLIWNFRIPKILAAVFGGGALGVSGLIMQSVFRNPLAGPFVLGISSGASLGVALVSLSGFAIHFFSVVPAAISGASLVIFVVLFCSKFLKSNASLLICGLMIGYLCDACVSFLVSVSEAKALKDFITWGMGSFSKLTIEDAPLFCISILFCFIPIILSVKYLNLAPLGDFFVKSHGLNPDFYKKISLFAASVLAGIVSAYCGPIAFLGLATPHFAYALFKTNKHQILIPATFLISAFIALMAAFVSLIPLQSFMSLVGCPVILWVLLRRKQ